MPNILAMSSACKEVTVAPFQLSSGNRANTYTGDLGGSKIDPFQRGPVKLRLY